MFIIDIHSWMGVVNGICSCAIFILDVGAVNGIRGFVIFIRGWGIVNGMHMFCVKDWNMILLLKHF